MLLLELCRLGPGGLTRLDPNPEDPEWVQFRWVGGRGGTGQVKVRADDEESLTALARATTEPRAYAELAAALARLHALDGQSHAWSLERVAELVYGPRGPSSHRERHLPHLRGWLHLLEHARWTLGAAIESPPKLKARSKSKGKTGRSGPASYGATIESDRLIVLEDDGTTVRLDPALAAALKGSWVAVPAEHFCLRSPARPNPEGNLPSRAARLRVRLAAALAGRWRHSSGQRVRMEELFGPWAGLDVAPLARRRRQASWYDDLVGELETTLATGGTGIDTRPAPERPLLRTLLRLVVGPLDRPSPSSTNPVINGRHSRTANGPAP